MVKASEWLTQEVVDNWEIEIAKVKSILNLLKKISKSTFGGGSVNGFIVKKATKGFVEGDMLKVLSYNQQQQTLSW